MTEKQIVKLKNAVLALQELAEMPEGWDGEEAFPIERATVLNCQYILSDKRAQDEFLTDVYPSPTGSVCMEWEKDGGKVSVEVSPNALAFYYVSADETEVYDSPIFAFGREAVENLYMYIGKLS